MQRKKNGYINFDEILTRISYICSLQKSKLTGLNNACIVIVMTACTEQWKRAVSRKGTCASNLYDQVNPLNSSRVSRL